MSKRKKRKKARRERKPSKASSPAVSDSSQSAQGSARSSDPTSGNPDRIQAKRGERANKAPQSKSKSSKSQKRKTGPDVSDRPLLEAYFFGGVDPVRPFLLLRLTLVLLAFDCWIDLVPHGGRYGVGGFNVAHFGILDVLLPTPSPAIYVGTLLLTGLLAMLMAFRPWRPGLGVLFGLYTYAWTMSMLDSYQHHYLLSLVLFSFAFFPTPAAGDVFEKSVRPGLALRRIAGLAVGLGTLEVVGTACHLETPLSQLGDSPWVLAAQAGLLVVGALWLFVDSESAPNEGNDSQGSQDPPHTPTLTSAWAYVSVAVTCAIVYFYTAITKLSPDWRSGAALQRLGNSDAFRAFESEATIDGLPLLGVLEVDTFWALMAKGAIAVQLVSAIGFLVAARQDSLSSKLRWGAVALGLAPLSFHIGAERMGLEIGWFSYYMLLVSVVYFAPARVLRPFAEAITRPARLLASTQSKATHRVAWGFIAVGAVGCVAMLQHIDLPGSLWAGVAAGALVVVAGSIFIRAGHASHARILGVALLGSVAVASIAISNSDVRFDYYRFVGGDHRRRGESEEALEAYIKAQLYCRAPYCVHLGRERLECFATESEAEAHLEQLGPGHTIRTNDRRQKIEEMRALLGRSAE